MGADLCRGIQVEVVDNVLALVHIGGTVDPGCAVALLLAQTLDQVQGSRAVGDNNHFIGAVMGQDAVKQQRQAAHFARVLCCVPVVSSREELLQAACLATFCPAIQLLSGRSVEVMGWLKGEVKGGAAGVHLSCEVWVRRVMGVGWEGGWWALGSRLLGEAGGSKGFGGKGRGY